MSLPKAKLARALHCGAYNGTQASCQKAAVSRRRNEGREQVERVGPSQWFGHIDANAA